MLNSGGKHNKRELLKKKQKTKQTTTKPKQNDKPKQTKNQRAKKTNQPTPSRSTIAITVSQNKRTKDLLEDLGIPWL